MMLAAFLRARAEGLEPAGDVIFCALADEEDMSALRRRVAGARARRAVRRACATRSASSAASRCTSAGGASIRSRSPRSRSARVRATLRGPPGHGSMPVRGGAMATARAGAASASTAQRLPVHVTPVARQMVEAMADGLAAARRERCCACCCNPRADRPRARPHGRPRARCSTRSCTTPSARPCCEARDKFNVIPGEVEVVLDGRLLPGFEPAGPARRAAGAARRRRRARGRAARPRPARARHGAVRDARPDPRARPTPAAPRSRC